MLEILSLFLAIIYDCAAIPRGVFAERYFFSFSFLFSQIPSEKDALTTRATHGEPGICIAIIMHTCARAMYLDCWNFAWIYGGREKRVSRVGWTGAPRPRLSETGGAVLLNLARNKNRRAHVRILNERADGRWRLRAARFILFNCTPGARSRPC